MVNKHDIKMKTGLSRPFLCLQNGMTDADVLRNITLSPTRYHYAHVAEIEVLAARQSVNAILAAVGHTRGGHWPTNSELLSRMLHKQVPGSERE